MTYIDNGSIDPKLLHDMALILNKDRSSLGVDLAPDLNTVFCIENGEGNLVLHSRKKIELQAWKQLWAFLNECPDCVENRVVTVYRS